MNNSSVPEMHQKGVSVNKSANKFHIFNTLNRENWRHLETIASHQDALVMPRKQYPQRPKKPFGCAKGLFMAPAVGIEPTTN